MFEGKEKDKSDKYNAHEVKITKIFTFESAHHLPNHLGACARIHGHSYRLEVTLKGMTNADPRSSEFGMLMDFSHLKHIVKTKVVNHMDHVNLNELPDSAFNNPTAENMAEWIWDTLSDVPEIGNKLYSIKLWETATGCVEINKHSHACGCK